MLGNTIIYLVGNIAGAAAGAGIGLSWGIKKIKAAKAGKNVVKDITIDDLADVVLDAAEKLASETDDYK